MNALRDASGAMTNGRFDDAIAILHPLDDASCDSRIALLLAAAYEGQHAIPRALETLQRAHATWGTDDHISVSLARLYVGTSQIDEAANALVDFRSTENTPAQEIEVAVLVFLGTHQLHRAEEAARRGYGSSPSLQSILLLANTLQLEGRYKDVIALLGAERQAYDHAAPFLVTLAQSEYDASMFEVTRTDAEHAVALDPKLYAAHYLLGNVLARTGATGRAITEYRLAIELSPNQPRTYYYLALSLRAEHREADEEDVLMKAIAVDDHYALAHCEMGRILLNQDRVQEALAQLNKAVEENASNEQAYYLLAKAYERAGNKEQAEAMAKRFALVSKANRAGTDERQEIDARQPGAAP